jgi:hypothetical protein
MCFSDLDDNLYNMCMVLFITSKFGKNVRREDRTFCMGLNEISFDVCTGKPCAIQRV